MKKPLLSQACKWNTDICSQSAWQSKPERLPRVPNHKAQVFITVRRGDTTVSSKAEYTRVDNIAASDITLRQPCKAECPPSGVSPSPSEHEFQQSLWSRWLPTCCAFSTSQTLCRISLSSYLVRPCVRVRPHVAGLRAILPLVMNTFYFNA